MLLKFYINLHRGRNSLKEDMYSYHYYKRRSVVRPDRTSTYLVQAAVLFGMAYAVVTLVVFFR